MTILIKYGKTAMTKQYAASPETSGWYIPSVGQARDIAKNLFGCEFSTTGDATHAQEQPYERRNMSTQFNWIPCAQEFSDNIWTSSISSMYRAWYIDINIRSSIMELNGNANNSHTKSVRKYVRPVLAF